jgi:hypothetical protein
VGDSAEQLNLPGLVQKPTVAERAFLVLARRWHDGFAVVDMNHAPPRDVDEVALACVLLAVEWGSDFTAVARNQCELNRELGSKREVPWIDCLPWELCEASWAADPRDTGAVETLTANLDHHNSALRGWCMELAWMCRPWLEKLVCTLSLLKNVADTLGGVEVAMGLARGLCSSDEELNEFIAAYEHQPPDRFANQFAERIKAFRDVGFFLTQIHHLDLECRCRRMIEGAVLGQGSEAGGTSPTLAVCQQVTVLLGIVEDAIEGIVTEFIQNTIPGHTVLTVRSARTLPDIQQATIEGKFDLAVLLLNNIITVGKDDRPLASALACVRHLASLGVPVISICGWSDTPNVADLAFAAGSRFRFPMPFDSEAFQAAVRQCLGL